MGNGHSIACGKHHIYDKIDEKCDHRQNETPGGAMMGNRKESLVTLDIKIENLDKEETNKENLDWGESAETGADEWLQENGWTNGQFRRREDILYNIFMIETENSTSDFNWSGLKSSGEPHYGRLASLDVVVLDNRKNENNYF